MKTRILLGISFLFYFAEAALSCPIYHIGKMYILDEQNKPVANAVVWRFRSLDDSFAMSKNDYDYIEDLDTNAFHFWSSGGWWRSVRKPDYKKADKYMRIHADGYADVIIKHLQFNGSWDEDNVPVLYVKMYTKKYITKGDLITIIDEYTCDRELKVKDSLTLGFVDYIQSIRTENAVATASRNAAFIVKTYPNPVLDKLNIQINAVVTVTKPYKATLMDMQGKTVSEMELSEASSVMDMQWEAKGLYFIQVFNPEGVLLYSLKFLKS